MIKNIKHHKSRYHKLIAATAVTLGISLSSVMLNHNVHAAIIHNNQPVKYTKQYVQNVNGYLTADTWYQPQKILKNGTYWVNSKHNDYRPILIYWWPNKNIKVNYINYFNQNGLGNKHQKVTKHNSNKTLDKATNKIQKRIEQKIKQQHSSKWLRTIMNNFINRQSIWNIKSEFPTYGWANLQGGSFKFVNNKLTPNVNSKYRYLGRAFTLQKIENTKNYELLLANDVDNSNPAVQAEDLNNLHYLMNISSILGKGADGNFDGGREDATGSLDYDVTQIAEQYFKDHFNMTNDKNSNAHLNLLEDGVRGSVNATTRDHFGALTHDMNLTNALLNTFTKPNQQRTSLQSLIDTDWVKRTSDYTENDKVPNYSFMNVHDGVQSLVGNIISNISKENPNAPTKRTLQKAIQIYDNDINKTNKKYAGYNIPSTYSLLLTNKDMIPRVYYGDLFVDGGQYMANKTIYYNAVTALLKARMKYVAGGQEIRIHDNGKIMSSVRFGKDNFKPTDENSRNSGIVTVTSNQQNLNLNNKVVIDLGDAHKNQQFRPLLMSKQNGLSIYNNDADAKDKTITTNDKGQLILDRNQVQSVQNPQVSGYLSTWVPVGAKDNQDVRTTASSEPSKDGNVFHANAALDSHVAYEGFSSLQANPTDNSQKTDVKLAQSGDFFKSLGITDVEFPGHYLSVKNDHSFVDSLENNGYAFNDRYNLGMNGQSTKYGTVEQMIDANKALHQSGIHTMADYVMNQLYGLNGKELTSVKRIDGYGRYLTKSHIKNDLYYAKTKSSGKDYQAQYGGKFLNELKNKYPDLFTRIQTSTGKTINANEHIKQWSAKYLNGTSIQGRGMGYILKDGKDNQYYSLNKNNKHIIK
ncbi:glycoside hydrolase family 70 protein [Apilactobacillus quenuiae]|uniref:glycoside hydrolase family 70 protein n=1 Tax=Apilactobacillus quenuiae TaxID=2008377 RepID=UPI000D01D0B6|nr:glycoside hydrolase family 70 protein [Apilactobacillus quenuiae]